MMIRTMLLAGAGTVALAAPAALAQAEQLNEAQSLIGAATLEASRSFSMQDHSADFTQAQNVFLPSLLAVDFTYREATATLPLYRGKEPDGGDAFYIITEASDPVVAERLGVNYAPKMRYAVGTGGEQVVTLDRGVMQFRGEVDFSPEYIVEPGDDAPFPPKRIQAGAKGDEEWSSMVVLPSGVVLNAQVIFNETGGHDRMEDIDLGARTVTMSVLDGFEGGEQFYYHLVTDASEEIAAVLEKGVWAPRMAKIDTFGQSRPNQKSALLGFSPVLNGPSDVTGANEQGFEASLSNGGIDPINVFPLDPDNANYSRGNNYSPLWDAHVSQWTEAAVADGERTRITSLGQLEDLVEAGLVESAFINPEGSANSYIAGLRPTRVTINCPVIAQPDASAVKGVPQRTASWR